VTRAAHLLHRSQPSVTAHVKGLEARAGQPLFVRVPRQGMSPTSHAHQLAREITPHLDALSAAQALLSPGALDEPLRLGGPPDLLALTVLPALAPLMKHGLRLHTPTGPHEPALDRLADGELDGVIVPGALHRPNLHLTPLFTEHFVLVGASTWIAHLPPAALKADAATALRDIPLLALDERLPIIALYWRSVFVTEPHGTPLATVNDLRAITSLARAGAGITVLPAYHAADGLQRGDLVLLHDPPRPPAETVHLVTRTAPLPGTPIAATIDAVRTHSRALSQTALPGRPPPTYAPSENTPHMETLPDAPG